MKAISILFLSFGFVVLFRISAPGEQVEISLAEIPEVTEASISGAAPETSPEIIGITSGDVGAISLLGDGAGAKKG